MITKKHRSKGGESNTHKTQNKSTITHTKPQLELTTQLEEFSTQMGLKSLSQRIECARMESWCLGMIKECLGVSSMRLGGPFYSPKAARSRGTQQGRQFLPSVRWRTGQSGAPLDNHCSMSGADLLPFLAQPTIGSSGWLAHRTLSGAHRTVRCPQPTVGVGHASRADCAADHCSGSHWFTGQSGAPPYNPVNYSRTPPTNSREWPVRQSPAWRTKHCPVHHRTVRCTQTEQQLAVHSQLFSNPFLFLILALRPIY
jgi:hypothetical protein